MKRLTNKSLVQFMVVFCWILSTEIPAQNTYALVIGLSQYKEITPLQFADRDAVAFTEFLKTQQVPENNIKLILNENATRLNVLDGMYNLTSQLKPNDRFYFYFGGHGDLEAQISSENSLLLLYNSFKKNYFQGSEFIQLFELKEWLGDLAKKQIEVVFIADACHSGGLIGGKEGISKTQTALNENWAGITKILSCKSDEFSLEGKQWGGGRGLFSYHLVNGLIGRADANGDKKISVGELDNYLKSNVAKQANPNVQTPVVIGNSQQVLSFANTEGLEKIAELEQKNFALMTEVNTRGDDKKSLDELAKLDTTIVETYKKFAKALKEKRIAPHDDSLDCALIHYRKLETYKLPDNLMQMIKRNMGVGLMELELDFMKQFRETGMAAIHLNPKSLSVIKNLDEAMNLFGSYHYIYKYLEARVYVLKLFIPRKIFGNAQSVEKNRRDEDEQLKKAKENLLYSLKLEPNMISTHSLLASIYRADSKPDSAIYYQEQVIKLLPNQSWTYYNLGLSYASFKYKDDNNKRAPHPKAIENLEKAIQLNPKFGGAYNLLAAICTGSFYFGDGETDGEQYQKNYAKAISSYESLLGLVEIDDSEIPKIHFENNTPLKSLEFNPQKANLNASFKNYISLQYLNNEIGNTDESEKYYKKIFQKAKLSSSFISFCTIAYYYYDVLETSNKKIYLSYALESLQEGLKIIEENVKTIAEADKPFLMIHYQQLLAGIGTCYRGLNNFNEAEKFLKQAIDIKVGNLPNNISFKLTGMHMFDYDGRLYTYPQLIIKANATDYHYQIEPNFELFFLKTEENKLEEALVWYEKALQKSVIEHGNDVMSKLFTEAILMIYKNLNKEAFLKLRNKYFPDAEKTKFEK